MMSYLASRFLQAVGVLWAAFTVSFGVLFLLPSDPVSMVAGSDNGTPVDAAAIEQLQARYGLDQPVWVQYWNALSNAVRGDFGISISTGRPVTEAIADALPSTFALASFALVLAVAFGTVVAFFSPRTRVSAGCGTSCSRCLHWVSLCPHSGWDLFCSSCSRSG